MWVQQSLRNLLANSKTRRRFSRLASSTDCFPCGLVYVAIAASLATMDTLQGVLLMFFSALARCRSCRTDDIWPFNIRPCKAKYKQGSPVFCWSNGNHADIAGHEPWNTLPEPFDGKRFNGGELLSQASVEYLEHTTTILFRSCEGMDRGFIQMSKYKRYVYR